MEQVKYFEIMSDRTKTFSTGNCLAVFTERRATSTKHEMVYALVPDIWQALQHENEPVYYRKLLRSFVDAWCKPVKHKRVILLHPRLIEEVESCLIPEKLGGTGMK